MSNRAMFTIVLSYNFSPGWLQKTWSERKEFEQAHIAPLFIKYAGRVRSRFFDAEAFCARVSDFIIFETDDLTQYYYLIEELRESPLLSHGFVTFADLLIGIEDGHQAFENDVLLKSNMEATC